MSASRRNFLKSIPLLGAAISTGNIDGYRPAGHIVSGTAEAMDIDYVTLDGRRVDHVFEANDVEGWVRHYGENPYSDGKALRAYFERGVVRYHYKTRKE